MKSRKELNINVIPRSALFWIIISTTIAFFIQTIFTTWFSSGFINNTFSLSLEGAKSFFLWQFVSYAFLHGGVWHFALNMLALYFAGRIVETSLGRNKFLALYFSGIVFGAILWALYTFYFGSQRASLVGASAGVIAVLAAFCTMAQDKPITFLLFLIIPVSLRPKVILYSMIVIEFLLLISASDSHIAYAAHLGGIAAGIVFAKLHLAGKLDFSFRKQKFFSATSSSSGMRYCVNIRSDEEIKNETNRILDKINKEGFASLTEDERTFLKDANKHFN